MRVLLASPGEIKVAEFGFMVGRLKGGVGAWVNPGH